MLDQLINSLISELVALFFICIMAIFAAMWKNYKALQSLLNTREAQWKEIEYLKDSQKKLKEQVNLSNTYFVKLEEGQSTLEVHLMYIREKLEKN